MISAKENLPRRDLLGTAPLRMILWGLFLMRFNQFHATGITGNDFRIPSKDREFIIDCMCQCL